MQFNLYSTFCSWLLPSLWCVRRTQPYTYLVFFLGFILTRDFYFEFYFRCYLFVTFLLQTALKSSSWVVQLLCNTQDQLSYYSGPRLDRASSNLPSSPAFCHLWSDRTGWMTACALCTLSNLYNNATSGIYPMKTEIKQACVSLKDPNRSSVLELQPGSGM